MTNPPTPHKLKSCPFCGEKPAAHQCGKNGAATMIECFTEGCVAPHVSYYGAGVAARKWNTRSPDLDSPALVDEVAKAIYEKQKHAMGFGKTWDQLKESQPHSRTSHRHLVTEAAQAAIAAIRKAL